MTLYTIGCPQCKVLESKLKNLNIDFDIVTDENIMKEKGFTQSPMLEVDGKVMNFVQSVEWLRTQY